MRILAIAARPIVVRVNAIPVTRKMKFSFIYLTPQAWTNLPTSSDVHRICNNKDGAPANSSIQISSNANGAYSTKLA
jgi:hypothetical protein